MKMTIAELKASLPQIGQVMWIGIRPERKGEIVPVSEISVSQEDAITGDHYARPEGTRMVTLIQAEHIKAMEQLLSRDIDPALLRRNIVVSGINLTALQDARFQIGEVVLEGTGLCHPCSRMEENLGPGGYNAMRGHGGLTTQVIQDGKIRIGDTVRYLSAAQRPEK